MITLKFLSQNECDHFYRKVKVLDKGENHLVFVKQNKSEMVFSYTESIRSKAFLSTCIENHLLYFYTMEWVDDYLLQHHHFYDYQERRLIVEIVFQHLNDEMKTKNKNAFGAFVQLRGYIHDYVQQATHININGFIRFRLKDWFLLLEKYIETAIDEYMLEQSYQQIIESIRNQLERTIPKYKELTIYVDSQISLYCENDERVGVDLQEYLPTEQTKLLLEDNITDKLIVYLIDHNPEKIVLFVTGDKTRLVTTLSNIFQEKVLIHYNGKNVSS